MTGGDAHHGFLESLSGEAICMTAYKESLYLSLSSFDHSRRARVRAPTSGHSVDLLGIIPLPRGFQAILRAEQ